MGKIKIILLIILPFLLIECFSQSVFLFKGERRYSILFKPFAKNIENAINTVEYKVDWNYETNKMNPGKFKHENVEYNINSRGFRGNEFNLLTNKVRILSFGGSTTIGLESPDNKTYPAQLEILLNEGNEKYEVINMGFGSKSLKYIKPLFVNEAINYKPEIITIYSNRNSIMYDSASSVKVANIKLLKFTTYLQENIMTYRLGQKTYNIIVNRKIKKNFLKSPFHKNGINEDYFINGYKNSLKDIINLSKLNNIKVVLIKQAYFLRPELKEIFDNLSSEELIKLYKEEYFIKNYKISKEDDFWLVFGNILNNKLDELENFENVIVVDPVSALLKNKNNFVDYLHLSPKGNFVLAREIYNKIK